MKSDELQTGRTGGYRWLLSTPSAWPDADPSALGLADPAGRDVGDLLAGALHDWRGEGYLTYHRYQVFDAMFRELVRPAERAALDHCTPDTQRAARTAFIDCARRIAMALGISQGRAEGMLQESTDLMSRHPLVAQRLRDGVISLDVVRKILERTDLISDEDAAETGPTAVVADDSADQPPAPVAVVDAAIAAELDRGAGAWSIHLVRDLADRIVFRTQPDAVRARREASKRERRVWTANRGDDMGLIAATMTGERIRISMESVLALAKSLCPNDPRTAPQRNSDAVFALLNQLPFECGCEDRDCCTATVVNFGAAASGSAVVPVKAKTVVHVVADKVTVDGRECHPGFMDGHGVISGDHVQDLIDDPTTVVRPLGSDDELAGFLDTVNRVADAPADVAPDAVDTDGTSVAEPKSTTGPDKSSEDAIPEGTVIPEVISEDAIPDDPVCPPAPESEQSTALPDAADSAGARGMPTGSADAPAATDEHPTTVRPTRRIRQASDHQGPSPKAEPTSVPRPEADRPSGFGAEIVLHGTQRHNPYRPSTALDTFIRIRDCYTLIPGNPHSAFHCDLDHWTEFNHDDPSAGGLTEPGNLGAKDRFAHNLKTHGDWVDDLIVDPDGHVRPIFITPEGMVIEGRAGPGLDLFPGLVRYRFAQPEASDRRKQCQPRAPSTSFRTRTADKHARRRAERELNRAARRAGCCIVPPAVRAIVTASLADAALGEPPF